MQTISDNSVDFILCDLPYGTTDCKWDTIIPFDPLWKQYRRIIKPNGVIALFSAQPFTTKLIHSNLKDYRYNWYWKKNNKTGALFCKHQPMRCVEDICVFIQRGPDASGSTYNPQGLRVLDKPIVHEVRSSELYVGKRNASVQTHTGYPAHLLEFDSETIIPSKKYHPTQKPVPLLEYLIKTYSNPDELVLDNCMGSGSTGVACANTGRRFIGIEMDDTYFKRASERISDAFSRVVR